MNFIEHVIVTGVVVMVAIVNDDIGDVIISGEPVNTGNTKRKKLNLYTK